MILSDGEILEYLDTGRLIAEPIEAIQIQPASIDIRLGDTFCVIDGCKNGVIKLGEEVRHKVIKKDKFVLYPGQFVLATTMETFIQSYSAVRVDRGRVHPVASHDGAAEESLHSGP